MNIKKLAILAGLIIGSVSGNALAQNPSIVVGDDSGAAGQQVTVPLTWDDGATTYNGVEFKVGFNDAILSFDSCVLNAPYDSYQLNICQLNGSDVEVGLIDNIVTPGAVPPGILAQVTFTIEPTATPGTTPLIVNNVVLPGDPAVDTTDGEIAVLGPTYSSSPAPGVLDVGSAVSGGADPQTVVNISNSGAGTLDVTCTDATGTGSVFTVSPNTLFSVDAVDPAVGVTVSCDADNSPDTYTGTMSCSHDGGAGGESSPAVYNLSCTITEGPQPAYTSVPADGTPINLVAPFQGDPITPAELAISNSGDAGTTLDGTCSFGMGTPQLTVSDGSFSLADGASETQFISCDSSVAGDYQATLSCTHNGSNASPATYLVSCDVGDPRPAIYSSDPADGSTVEMTASFDGGEAVVGESIPDSDLVITNTAVAGSYDLAVQCDVNGPAPVGITVDPIPATTLVPGASTSTTFSCSSATAGFYELDYVCDWTTEGEGLPEIPLSTGSATYTYNCDVREAESDVSTSPASGSTITELAQPGGSATYDIVFTENNGEGADGVLETCSLTDGTDFTITAPTFPADIPSGGSVTVTVEGTDPGDVESITDTLTCEYRDSDSDGDSDPAEVTYDLVMAIGGSGNFTVTKDFSDDNPAPVTVTLTCDTGLPLVQSFEITESTTVGFVVTDYESGAMNCSVTEEPVPGYEAFYAASGDSDSDNIDGCNFTAVATGDANACAITNIAEPGTFTLNKEWVVTEETGQEVAREALMFIACDREILFVDVEFDPDYDGPLADVEDIYFVFGPLFGNSSAIAVVDTSNGPARCTGGEFSELDLIFQSGVEVTSDCPPYSTDGGETFTDPSTWLEVTSGSNAECTVTNTVFFEGIPTLSQWGMAIMALLMLGVGMVGFRRFT